MTNQTLSRTERLFSYGTLQFENVQLATFGRLLEGRTDAMLGHTMSMVAIDDPAVVATSGKTHHPIVAYSGKHSDRVDGMVFAVTPEELQLADTYEVASYRRVAVALASGATAWVYVDARLAPFE